MSRRRRARRSTPTTPRGRITKADCGGGRTVSYSYDSAGNRTSTSMTGFPAAPVKVVVLPLLGGLVIPLPN